MHITLRIHQPLERFAGGSNIDLDLESGTVAEEAILATGIPKDEIGILTRGEERIGKAQLLQDGDIVDVYPPIMGG